MEDAVRKLIDDTLKSKGKTYLWLSLQLGKNPTYIQQYIRYRKPEKLAYDEKVKIHKLLGIKLEQLGVIIPAGAAPSPTAGALGHVADVAPYTSSDGVLQAHPHLTLYRALTRALEQHRLRIEPGDVIFVDPSDSGRMLEDGQAYVVMLYDKVNELTATLVIRQHVPPGLLITNSRTHNLNINLEDEALPFEPVIEGRIIRLLRGNHH